MDNIKYPVYRPSLNGNERAYVLDCLDSSWISSKGAYIGRFETKFARALSEPVHAVAVCNGTVALHLCLLALGIGPGDEVIVPTLTYVATANAVSYVGATPVLADSIVETWQLDPADVARLITSRTKAIIAVHLYGHPSPMDELMAIAEARGIAVVEDCAESFGSYYHGKQTGTFGRIASFSFFGNKTLTTGEGGMVVTSSSELFRRVTRLKGQGLAEGREYWHDVVGYNYRMTNICAAIGLAQLERLDHTLAEKRRVALSYRRHLADVPLTFQTEAAGVVHSYWMVSALVPRAEQRDRFRRHLAASGIETRPTFCPLHTMPMYCNTPKPLVVAEDLGDRGVCLPSYPDLAEEDIAFIATQARRFFAEEGE